MKTQTVFSSKAVCFGQKELNQGLELAVRISELIYHFSFNLFWSHILSCFDLTIIIVFFYKIIWCCMMFPMIVVSKIQWKYTTSLWVRCNNWLCKYGREKSCYLGKLFGGYCVWKENVIIQLSTRTYIFFSL